MKLERIAKYDYQRLLLLKMYRSYSHSIEHLMGVLQSQMEHFRFSSLGLKQYQQHLCDHKWGQLMTDPLVNSSKMCK